jgi:hypothetical protein
MPWRIVSLATVRGTEALHVLVDFWPSEDALKQGEKPHLREEFVMELRAQGERVVTDNDGNCLLADGTAITPEDAHERLRRGEQLVFQRETFGLTPKEQMVNNIAGFVAMAERDKISGDYTLDSSKPYFLDGKKINKRAVDVFAIDHVADPKGLKQDAGIIELVQKGSDAVKVEAKAKEGQK